MRDAVRRGGFVGLKCYHTMARVEGPTWRAPIETYLPEPLVRLAHEERLSISLHIVRDRALADPSTRQPFDAPARNTRICACGSPTLRAASTHGIRLKASPACVDCRMSTSIPAPSPKLARLKPSSQRSDTTACLYGADFPTSHMRGRCVAIRDSFHWFSAEDMRLEERHTALRLVMVGIESLRSLKLAAWRLKLSDRQIEDIFCTNAARLYGFA
ncbi:MAG: hypothetical protein NZ699_16185 [Roseiflexus sp.]|nr:hypothetical protein [Roseiflexus sp.]MDW8145454.1 hypothetical protein [Roseiflexaceae bacterium]